MKQAITLAFLIFGVIGTNTQAYSQVSLSYSVGVSGNFSSNVKCPLILKSLRLNFAELDDEVTLSLGTHVGTLIFLLPSRFNAFAMDIPLVVEANFGHAAHPNTQSYFGGFAGLGFGFNYMAISSNENSRISGALGPVINAGIRFFDGDQSIGLRLSYLYNMKGQDILKLGPGDYYSSVFGIGVTYNFGNF